MATYTAAPEVAAIANDVMDGVERHKPLKGVRIEYVWRSEAALNNGRIVLAKARKVAGLNAHLANTGLLTEGDLFVIEVAQDTWGRLSAEQHRALIDHELCHLVVSEDDEGLQKLSIVGHDLEEFACIVDRHGFWKSDVARFGASVAEQLSLAIDDAARFMDEIKDPPPPPNVDGETGEIEE